MGTTVLAGRAVMEVKKIGLSTKIGEIATTIRETEEPETTMQLRLKRLTKSLVRLSIVLCSLIFVYGFFAGREMLEMLEISAVLLVAVIPEAYLLLLLWFWSWQCVTV
jgi:Ca2+-transporting ATPase